ncbi:MAG: carboxypeptidase-like regulatory domain-containing protein, partial [Candidatus Kapaibacterium sp.]
LAGATASVTSASNTIVGGAVCDTKGRFFITNLPDGPHTLSIRFLGYETMKKRLRLQSGDTLRLGSMRLSQASVTTDAVEVEAVQTRGEQKGDTTEFNARAFKTDKNASAEDLVRKMPGVEVDNGQVKAQGEQVRRVLVDGKPFFGDDAATTLKTLPSDIIDKVQVYDQGSDQAQFTKFDDGERNKTINVVTRPDKRNGIFGKGFAGYGTDDRYNAGGNVNLFNGDRRITVLALSNNINEQNFAIQDLVGMMGGGGSWMRMAGRSMAMFSTSGGSRMAGMGSRGGGGGSDFMISPSDGISRTHGVGVNYQDQFGKSVAVTGSYFFNTSKTDQVQSLNRIYYLSDQTSQSNLQDNTNLTDNTNHRLNLRAEVSLDSMSSLLVSPRMTWQNIGKSSVSKSVTENIPSAILNTSDATTASDNSAFNLSSDILYRLRFATEGRTLSANLTNNHRNNSGTSDNVSDNLIFGTDTILLNIHQNTPTSGRTNGLTSNFTYTEPVATNHQLQLNYTYSTTSTSSDRNTYDADAPTVPLPGLSNSSTSDYRTHRGGASYRFSILPPPDSSGKPKTDPMMMMMGGGGMGRGMMGMMGG